MQETGLESFQDQTRTAPLALAHAPAVPCRVLVVKDEPTIVRNVVDYLEAQHRCVDIAWDSQAALSLLEQSAAGRNGTLLPHVIAQAFPCF